MISYNPIEIKGNWTKGYALDIHTTSSEYLGDDEFGHPRFKTKYSELGESVLRLKYREDKSVLKDILDAITDFLKNKWKIMDTLDYIVPAPPSKLNREYQPVIEIVEKLSDIIDVPMCIDSLVKIKATQELKEIVDYEERKRILKDAFDIQNDCIKDKNILLFDDLYRSGATLKIITEVLYNKGKVNSVYILTLTKTRSKR